MSAILLAQQILNGLLDGVYYLLIALGLSLIFSVGGIVNLAHGAFYALGAYISVEITKYLGFGPAVPGPNEDLEVIAATKEENSCTFPS